MPVLVYSSSSTTTRGAPYLLSLSSSLINSFIRIQISDNEEEDDGAGGGFSPYGKQQVKPPPLKLGAERPGGRGAAGAATGLGAPAQHYQNLLSPQASEVKQQ